MADAEEEAVRAAIAGEMRLLDPRVRASPAEAGALLDPEFTEFGASGRRWDATSILTALGPGPDAAHPAIRVTDMTGTMLAPGIVHLTYTSDAQGRRAHRSSLWRLTRAGWLLYFHQGTLTGDPE